MSRTKEGRDALRSSEAHPQARSIAPARPERSQRRVPIGRHRPKSAETGEAHPPSGADLRHMRRRGAGFASLTAAAHAYRPRLKTGFFNEIDVKRTVNIATGGVAVGRSHLRLGPAAGGWSSLRQPSLAEPFGDSTHARRVWTLSEAKRSSNVTLSAPTRIAKCRRVSVEKETSPRRVSCRVS